MKSSSFDSVVHSRRSVRRFTDKPVSFSLVKKILEYATYAPTNCNQQAWSFVVVTENAIKERLIKEAASSTLIGRAPVVIVASYDGWNYKEAIQGASIAVQNILLGATAHGVGALSMNSYGADSVIKNILHIPDHHVICCFLLLGYPDTVYKNTPRVPRRPVDEILHVNKYTPQPWEQSHNSYDPEQWTLDALREFQKHYCRKTFLGKEMDIYAPQEKEIVKHAIGHLQGNVLDLFSYDGSYLETFPEETNVHCVDLTKETSEYAASAVKGKECKARFTYGVYDEKEHSPGKGTYDNATLLYKAERLPRNVLRQVFKQTANSLKQGGEFIIIARRRNVLFTMFHSFIKHWFGDDTRKTGMYSFFGPYTPPRVSTLIADARRAGFEVAEKKYHCTIPPFFDQAYQMFLQYKKSGGTTYLHRLRINTPLTKMLAWLLRVQGLRTSVFGSITAIRLRKK